MLILFIRAFLVVILLLTASLSLWKSSLYQIDAYRHFEWYFGGASVLHASLSFIIGFLVATSFPKHTKPVKHDPLGLRLLFILLCIVSLEELSQLFLTQREFSIGDLHTNWVGVCSGFITARAITKCFRW